MLTRKVLLPPELRPYTAAEGSVSVASREMVKKLTLQHNSSRFAQFDADL